MQIPGAFQQMVANYQQLQRQYAELQVDYTKLEVENSEIEQDYIILIEDFEEQKERCRELETDLETVNQQNDQLVYVNAVLRQQLGTRLAN